MIGDGSLAVLPPLDEFERLRFERLLALNAKAKLEEEQRKASRAQQLKVWQDDGQSALNSMGRGLSRVASYIRPHSLKKEINKQLLENAAVLFNGSGHEYFYTQWFCTRLLNQVNPVHRRRMICQKSQLILWRFEVMRQVRDSLRLPGDFAYADVPSVSRVRVLRVLDKWHRHDAIVEPDILSELKSLKRTVQRAEVQLAKVQQAQDKCDFIPLCKAALHYESAGCPTCGVIHIGSSSNLQQFVKSVDRQTGLETLVTLEFELGLLRGEREVAEVFLQSSKDKLHEFEFDIQFRVRCKIQAWWCVIRARRILDHREAQLEWSAFHVRNRRLTRLKRAIDALFVACPHEPSPDFSSVTASYMDCRDAAVEYGLAMQTRREARVSKISGLFRDKLRVAVARGRQKRFREAEKARLLREAMEGSIKASRREKVLKEMRSIVKHMRVRQFVCIRPECNYRLFLSKDRYETHMKYHVREDSQKGEKRQTVALAFQQRCLEEKEMLARMRQSRSVLEQLSLGGESSQRLAVTQVSISVADTDESPHASTSIMISAEDHEMPVTTSLPVLPRSKFHLEVDTGFAIANGAMSKSIQDELKRLDLWKDTETDDNELNVQPSPSRNRSRSHSRSPSRGGALSRLSPPPPGSAARRGTGSLILTPSGSAFNQPPTSLNPTFDRQLGTLPWMRTPHHMHKVVTANAGVLYHLELVSRQASIGLPRGEHVPLDAPVMRFGSLAACECPIELAGVVAKESRICKIHCLFYVTPSFNAASNAVATVVDNHSQWGTYVVNATGAYKVPSKVTAGMCVGLGDLVCIGVLPDGPPILDPTKANTACLVFKVCSVALEGVSGDPT